MGGGVLLPGPLRAPPEDLNPQGFRWSSLGPHYAARAYSPAKLSFAVSLTARNGEPRREKAIAFTRLSMLIGPALPAITRERLVEPPGIAPGSSPLITRAFISIVRASPNPPNIGAKGPAGKEEAAAGRDCRCRRCLSTVPLRSCARPSRSGPCGAFWLCRWE